MLLHCHEKVFISRKYLKKENLTTVTETCCKSFIARRSRINFESNTELSIKYATVYNFSINSVHVQCTLQIVLAQTNGKDVPLSTFGQ